MPTAYENTLADRWDAGLSDDPDDQTDAREESAQRRARELMNAR